MFIKAGAEGKQAVRSVPHHHTKQKTSCSEDVTRILRGYHPHQRRYLLRLVQCPILQKGDDLVEDNGPSEIERAVDALKGQGHQQPGLVTGPERQP